LRSNKARKSREAKKKGKEEKQKAKKQRSITVEKQRSKVA
jgi:hypothetical protein